MIAFTRSRQDSASFTRSRMPIAPVQRRRISDVHTTTRYLVPKGGFKGKSAGAAFIRYNEELLLCEIVYPTNRSTKMQDAFAWVKHNLAHKLYKELTWPQAVDLLADD